MRYHHGHHSTHPQRSQSGFSLVELMVASAIGLAMLAPVIGLFISSKRSYNENDRMSAVVDNGRYALSTLADDLRKVDFWGPGVASGIDVPAAFVVSGTDCAAPAAGYTLTTSLWVTTAAAATVAGCVTDAAVNSDVVFVKHTAGTSTSNTYVAGRNYAMVNEVKGVLFVGAGDGSAPSTNPGGTVPGGTAWEYQAFVYYVNNASPPMLVRRQLNGNTWSAGTEVAAGIERIRLLLGVDNGVDGVADAYVNAAGVTNWSRVVSARLFVLARSENTDAFNTDPRTYTLASVAYTPNDNFVRMLLESSVAMRNRQLQITGGR